MKHGTKLMVASLSFIALVVVWNKGIGKDKEEEEVPTYIGTWIRQATYTGDVLRHREPATLTFKKTSFRSLNRDCENSGLLRINDNIMRMTTEETTCLGHSPGTVTISTFEISSDGSSLEIINTQYGAEVKEIYTRK
ncbi:MAG: hypothetical protein JSW40_01335 [Candidatus Omnitrophota bacterium]|nr:MAG: hypothetical protein JSW40_01335 [Candidatus Omnitrophota bacterium]